DRRMFHGRCRTGTRPDVVRRAVAGARRSGTVAAGQRRRFLGRDVEVESSCDSSSQARSPPSNANRKFHSPTSKNELAFAVHTTCTQERSRAISRRGGYAEYPRAVKRASRLPIGSERVVGSDQPRRSVRATVSVIFSRALASPTAR